MRKIILLLIFFALCSTIIIFVAFRNQAQMPDAIIINDIVQNAFEYDSAYQIVEMIRENLYVYIKDMDAVRHNRDSTIQMYLLLAIFIFTIAGILLCVYYERNFLLPFRKLQNFAKNIAAGDLNTPLEMDKHNIFGAFTESFDLMREELQIAKENEIRADKSKKELVASLVHDITTPIASVRSAIDILHLRAKDENEIKLLNSSDKKLQQIDALVTNIFHATLKELQKLDVIPTELQSTDIYELLEQADYKNRIKPFSIPNCLVIADSLRLQQVFDNLTKNSYKYADTDICIASFIDEDYLFIEIRDFGLGVSEIELPLITSKFYRGKNAENLDGYGLGLHLSKYFMEQMEGGLYPENHENGFMIVITLRLAGPKNI